MASAWRRAAGHGPAAHNLYASAGGAVSFIIQTPWELIAMGIGHGASKLSHWHALTSSTPSMKYALLPILKPTHGGGASPRPAHAAAFPAPTTG